MLKYILPLLLVGCAGVNVDPELKGYIDEFDREIGTNSFVNATFVPYMPNKTESNLLGVCLYSGSVFAPNTIQVDRGDWDFMTDTERKQLMWHELGHCVLGLKHDETILEDGYPKSIMFPQLMPDFIWNLRFDRFKEELSNRAKLLNRFLEMATSKPPGVQVN